MEKYCPKCHKVHDMKAKHCMECGTKLKTREKRKPIPKGLRHKILVRDGYRCRECGKSKDETSLEIDHIFPLSRGGKTEISNLWTLCRDCNQSKSNDIWKDERLETCENELETLYDILHKAEEGLKNTSDYDEELEYKFRIKKLTKEDIPAVEKKLNKIKNEVAELDAQRKARQEENRRRERLFKKLYVELDDEIIDELKDRLSLKKTSSEEVLRKLVDQYDENGILSMIKSIKNKLAEEKAREKLFNKLSHTLSNQEIELFKKEFSLKGSKSDIINYLLDNYTEDKIYSLKSKLIQEEQKRIADEKRKQEKLKKKKEKERKKKLIKKLEKELTPTEKELFYREYSNKTSKKEIVPYIVNNYSEKEIKKKRIELLKIEDEKRKEEERKQRIIEEKEKQINYLYYTLEFKTMSEICKKFNITEKYYVDDLISYLKTLNPEEVNEIYNYSLKFKTNEKGNERFQQEKRRQELEKKKQEQKKETQIEFLNTQLYLRKVHKLCDKYDIPKCSVISFINYLKTLSPDEVNKIYLDVVYDSN